MKSDRIVTRAVSPTYDFMVELMKHSAESAVTFVLLVPPQSHEYDVLHPWPNNLTNQGDLRIFNIVI